MKPFLKILNIFKTLFFLILLLSSPVFITPILVIALVPRLIVWLLAKGLRPDLDSFVMKENSCLALRNGNRAEINIICAVVIDGVVTKEELRKSGEEKILNVKNPLTGTYVYGGLRKSWEGFMGYAFWKWDPNFEIKHHVRDYDYGGKLQISNPCTVQEYRKALEGLIDAPWDRRRSPWEALVIPNFAPEEGKDQVKTAVVFRIDHVLADGYNLLNMVKKLTGSPFKIPEFKLAARKLSTWEKVGLAVKIPWDVARNMGMVFGAKKLHHGKSMGKQTIVSVSPKIRVECIKEIKNHFKVSYAAVIYAAIFGALEKALKVSGQTGPERLATAFVLPKRGHPEGLCIHATGMLAEWPMTSCSSVERLHRIQRNFVRLTQSSAALLYPYLAHLGAYFPMGVRRALINISINLGISIGFSNFPVTLGPDFYEGKEILEMDVALGTYLSLGMFMVTGGLNNQQVFTFSVNENVFASLDCASQLGLYVKEEIRALTNAMV